jgi:ParB family chromosome partitioning protein
MSASKQSLGRGLGALISDDLDRSILQEDSERVQKLLITDIVPNPDQPRREFDQSALKELAQSIEQHGVVQPIIVVRFGQANQYRIVAGERRWRAAQLAKQTHLPAIVRSMRQLEEIELSLIENIQRVDLSPLEQALSVYKLQHQFNLALEDIAKKLGKARPGHPCPKTVAGQTSRVTA